MPPQIVAHIIGGVFAAVCLESSTREDRRESITWMATHAHQLPAVAEEQFSIIVAIDTLVGATHLLQSSNFLVAEQQPDL